LKDAMYVECVSQNCAEVHRNCKAFIFIGTAQISYNCGIKHWKYTTL